MSAGRRIGPFLVASLAAAAAVGASASPATADIVGAGPDETIQQAYGPLVQSVTYSGAFTNPNDVDYLAFNVASAGQSLHFTVSNTMRSCNSPDQDSCPLYATLMDQTNHQVGGDTSSAGTVATVNDTETIDWTFDQPGTYYVLMESNGNLPPGQPTYTVRIGPPPTGPVVKSITVARHQRGFSVRGTVVLGQPAASLHTTLFALAANGRQIFVATSSLNQLTARTYNLGIRLPAFWRHRLIQRHSLSLLLKFTIVTTSGSHLNFTRPVALRPEATFPSMAPVRFVLGSYQLADHPEAGGLTRPGSTEAIGFDEIPPRDAGWSACRTAPEAAEALDDVDADYEPHQRAARTNADEVFDARKRLTEMLAL